jgi:AraC-like DNA-binding protein
MDGSATGPGYSVSIPGPPFSPWLRLAHVWRIPAAQAAARGGLRRITDFELFLQIEGSSWIAVHGVGHVPLPAGHLAWIPPGLAHAWGHLQGGHLAVHADLHARPAIEPMAMLQPLGRDIGPGPVLRGWDWSLVVGGEPLRVPLVRRIDAPRWRRLLDPLVEMYGARRHRSPAARLGAAAILGEAFAELMAGGAGAGDEQILALLAEAAVGPAGPCDVAALARRCGLGETAFRAAVRRATGRSPRAQIERLRLDRAAYALRSAGTSVAEAAAVAGYADPFHFSRVFRRVFGAPPRAWRATG